MHLYYGDIMKKAWNLTIKNKILWVFGFFASFISLEAAYEILFSQVGQAKEMSNLHLKIINLYQYQLQFVIDQSSFLSSLAKNLPYYLLIIVFLTIAFLFIWLIFVSQVFVIRSAAKLDKSGKFNGLKEFNNSLDKFWPVLGINIIAKLVLYAGYIALTFPMLYSLLLQSKYGISISNIIFLVLYTFFAVVISFITAYATNFIILKDLYLLDAIKQSWRLFRKNIAISLEIAAILFVLKIFSVIIVFSLTALIVLPLMAIFAMAVASFNIIGVIMTITLSILTLTIASVLVNSIFTCFYLSTWTLTFMELTERFHFSKMSKLFSYVKGLFVSGKKQPALKALRK